MIFTIFEAKASVHDLIRGSKTLLKRFIDAVIVIKKQQLNVMGKQKCLLSATNHVFSSSCQFAKINPCKKFRIS